MRFTATELEDTYIIESEPHQDERGSFARIYCVDEFREQGIDFQAVQSSISTNRHKATLRGMHYQAAPHQEAKLVQCLKGSLYDVVLDLRSDSLTYKQWMAVELSGQDSRMVYVPPGCAHGFQTLTDNTEVLYMMDEFYHPECAQGVRWDDSAFNIRWPVGDPIVSEQDKSWLAFDF